MEWRGGGGALLVAHQEGLFIYFRQWDGGEGADGGGGPAGGRIRVVLWDNEKKSIFVKAGRERRRESE